MFAYFLFFRFHFTTACLNCGPLAADCSISVLECTKTEEFSKNNWITMQFQFYHDKKNKKQRLVIV